MQVFFRLSSLVDPSSLVTENCWGCLYVFREQYNVLQKAVRALITFSQTPQLEELAALAPRTPYPALGPAFYTRRSNVLCHRKSLCLSVVCHL